MSEKIIKEICKWVSIVLILIAMFMLFSTKYVISDKDDRTKTKNNARDLEREIESNLSKENLKLIQKEADKRDIDIDFQEFKDQLLSIVEVLEDGKITLKEIISKRADLVGLIDTINDNYEDIFEDGFGYDEIDDQIDEIIDGLDDIKKGLIVFIGIFVLTLVFSVVVIILHVVNSKLPGISAVMIYIVWLITNFIMLNKLNKVAEDGWDKSDDFFKMQSAPVWPLILVLIAMLLWIFKDKLAEIGSKAVVSVPVFQEKTLAAKPMVYCSNCGEPLNEGAAFCPQCGMKYEPMAAPKETESVRPGVCPQCGSPIDPDTVFCGNCGYKV